MLRFISKYKKWYGVDREVAKEKWESYVRDKSVDRYYEDDILFLAAPLTGTYYSTSGSRVADRRSIQETRKVNAGDEDAIKDERNCPLAHFMILGLFRSTTSEPCHEAVSYVVHSSSRMALYRL